MDKFWLGIIVGVVVTVIVGLVYFLGNILTTWLITKHFTSGKGVSPKEIIEMFQQRILEEDRCPQCASKNIKLEEMIDGEMDEFGSTIWPVGIRGKCKDCGNMWDMDLDKRV